MKVEVKWSGVRSNRSVGMRLSKKGPKVGTKWRNNDNKLCKSGLNVGRE